MKVRDSVDMPDKFFAGRQAASEDAPACLNFPPQHRRRIRTTNGLERWLAGGQYLDISLLKRLNQEHEAELKLETAMAGAHFTELSGLDRYS